ncbi:uncharacterized protein Dvir_GJ14607 [Drosophila virilis]|uniref:CLIP domain-containing serine protease n=1 Tax=Drosophila virilis TaxID=7244 RepID=B4MHD2_DROVI|nr:uncharacterized protein Dvir_GJ14607 [Drosophila virilis]
MYIAGTSQMSTFIWLLVIICVAGSVGWPIRQEGDPCTWTINYPKSHCRLAKNCQTLPVYIDENFLKLTDIPSCGFLDASHSEMFCCPDEMPGPKVSSLTLAAPTFHNSLNHLASLGYYKADTLDEIEYRCTAIILSPNQLLATSKCVGNKIYEKPNRVLVGVTDPRKFFDPELEFELTVLSVSLFITFCALYQLEMRLKDIRVFVQFKYSGRASTDKSIGSCPFQLRQKRLGNVDYRLLFINVD